MRSIGFDFSDELADAFAIGAKRMFERSQGLTRDRRLTLTSTTTKSRVELVRYVSNVQRVHRLSASMGASARATTVRRTKSHCETSPDSRIARGSYTNAKSESRTPSAASSSRTAGASRASSARDAAVRPSSRSSIVRSIVASVRSGMNPSASARATPRGASSPRRGPAGSGRALPARARALPRPRSRSTRASAPARAPRRARERGASRSGDTRAPSA